MGALRLAGGALAVAAIIVACGGKLSGTNPCADCDRDGSVTPVYDAKPIFDVKQPPPPPPDAQPPPPMCPTPADVSSFAPPAFVPPHPVMNVCSPTQVQGFYDDCFGNNQQSCMMFKMANMTCDACLESQETDSQWGAVVEGKAVVRLDVAGCVYLQGDVACAKAMEQSDACASAACDAQCPISDQQSFADWNKCIQTALAGGCKKYADAMTMICTGNALPLCSKFQDFQTGFLQYGALFCSGGG